MIKIVYSIEIKMLSLLALYLIFLILFLIRLIELNSTSRFFLPFGTFGVYK